MLTDLAGSVREILGDTHIGTYVQGSFALGAGDRARNRDFATVTAVPPAGGTEADLRRPHDEIPPARGTGTTTWRGAHADAASSLGAAGPGAPRLYRDRGHLTATYEFAAHAETFVSRNQ